MAVARTGWTNNSQERQSTLAQSPLVAERFLSAGNPQGSVAIMVWVVLVRGFSYDCLAYADDMQKYQMTVMSTELMVVGRDSGKPEEI